MTWCGRDTIKLGHVRRREGKRAEQRHDDRRGKRLRRKDERRADIYSQVSVFFFCANLVSLETNKRKSDTSYKNVGVLVKPPYLLLYISNYGTIYLIVKQLQVNQWGAETWSQVWWWSYLLRFCIFTIWNPFIIHIISVCLWLSVLCNHSTQSSGILNFISCYQGETNKPGGFVCVLVCVGVQNLLYSMTNDSNDPLNTLMDHICYCSEWTCARWY